MAKGYNGKVLFVDLTAGSIKEEGLPEKIYRDFIGGQGLGARILYERMKPRVDPLGPDNMLGFVIGLLTGTGIHGSRFQMVGKSPLTGGWGDNNSGGSFGAELKAAGYDGVFFSGISSKPVYLFLHDGKAELKDATHLWGKDTVETAEIIKDELGDKRVKVAAIGPAGEAKSLLAAVIQEGGAAARSGLGAVMGSKCLKALVTRGTKKVELADPERFTTVRKDYLKNVKQTKTGTATAFKTWGTCGDFSCAIIRSDAPIKNWTLFGEEEFPNHANLSDDAVIKHQVKKHACLGCPLGCKGWYRIETSSHGIVEGTKPEYETLAMIGSDCLIDDLGAVAKANDLCNLYGLDTIGVGAAIAFAMECYDNGVITKEDTDGIELTWGNGAAMVAMVEKIARREGFGAVLADGSRLAAEHIGKGSEKWAIHVGGQDVPAHDPRSSIGYAWTYICDATPARHTSSESMFAQIAEDPYAIGADLHFPKVNPLDIEANAPIFATCSDLDRLWSSVGLCNFGFYPDTFPLVEAISAVTGWDFSLAEGLKAGRRIHTLRQAFNIREGANTGNWTLPERLTITPATGPLADIKIDFKTMKERGYAALGWDAKTGQPLESTLEELGLKELVGQLP